MRALLACTVLLGALAPATPAQPSSRFTGTWERVWTSDAQHTPTVATRGDAGFETGDMSDGWGWGSPVTITERADSLIVSYVFFATYDLQPPIRLAYALDGSESRNTLMIGHTSVTQRARVRRQGDALVIEAAYPNPVGVEGASTTVRQTLTRDGDGRLVIETVRSAPSGADTTRTSYTRRVRDR